MKSSRVTVSWTVLVAVAVGLVSVTAGATYLSLRTAPEAATVRAADTASAEVMAAAMPSAGTTPASMPASPFSDVIIPLSAEWADRAGIVTVTVADGNGRVVVRAPGIVEPNGYANVSVTPLLDGRITHVSAEPGDHVREGESLARIFSPELAEWQTTYVSARAELEAHERELARTERLAVIGSASRQELERLHAEHVSRRAALQSVAFRLRLFGLSVEAIEALDAGNTLDATISVPAPFAGVVTERTANVGLNVDETTRLFTVANLTSVWVVADLYEEDFARIHVGTPAVVTTRAYPGRTGQGRVGYIDPQLRPESRTARVRIEVPNADGQWRFGMLVDVVFAVGETNALLIPREAIQRVGERAVVYLVNPVRGGEFIEREVQVGTSVGDQIAVVAGLASGDRIVSTASFSVRAERERLGLRPETAPAMPVAVAQQSSESVQTAQVVVGEAGYDPATFALRAGVLARITFVRTTDKTCGTEVVFPSLKLKRALPLDTPVVIEFTPAVTGAIGFVCGMNMLKGTVVVR